MAVFTHLTEQDIDDITDSYGIKILQFNEIAEGSENTNYLLVGDKKKYVLTLFEGRIDIDNISYYYQLMNILYDHGINCPQVISNKNGNFIFTHQNKIGIIISFLEGKSVKFYELDVEHCLLAGKQLARMHLVSRESLTFDEKFHLPNKFSLNFIEENLDKIANEGPYGKINNLIEEELSYQKLASGLILKNHDHLPMGCIHGDYFVDNVFFNEDYVGNINAGVIDFNFSCWDYLIYDLAIAASSWCYNDGGELHVDKLRAIINGYNSIREITSEEMKYFIIFFRRAALRFLSTRYLDLISQRLAQTTASKDPWQYYSILLDQEIIEVIETLLLHHH